MQDFDTLLKISAAAHGHLCPGQVVRDNREVVQNDHILCKPCAQGAYFSQAEEITWPKPWPVNGWFGKMNPVKEISV